VFANIERSMSVYSLETKMILKNKIAVIYAAGGAVGGAVARAFAREGARLFVTGRHHRSKQSQGKSLTTRDSPR
jgi:NAD(P)-dependent dehydrogenase (short-subunit alcohol dehydrogenase family)